MPPHCRVYSRLQRQDEEYPNDIYHRPTKSGSHVPSIVQVKEYNVKYMERHFYNGTVKQTVAIMTLQTHTLLA